MGLIQFGIVLKAFDQMSSVFGSAARGSINALSRVDQKVSALSAKMEGLGTKAMGDGALLTGLMQKPVQAFAEAEDAATGLKVAMLGAGNVLDAKYGKISGLATDLGNQLPGTTADFQNMMSALVKQGISYDAILGGVGKSAAYLGVMLKKPPEQAAEFVAKLQDATGTAEKDMLGLMDTIQRATYLGVDDGNMLAFFTKMTPAMDTMKRKGADAAKEMAPFAVMFDQAGMQGEAAGNALRKVVQLGMDLKKVNKANADLASKGIKLDFTDGKGEFGGMANVMAQLDKLKGLNTAEQLKALKSVFGDDAETLQVLSILINKGADGYNETVDKMAKQASLQQRVNMQLGTLKNLWDAASGSFTNTMAAFGESISPELKSLTQWLGDASQAMSGFIAEHPRLARATGMVIGGFGALLLLGGGLVMTLGMVTKLSGLALSPLTRLFGLFRKKGGAAGAAATAADAAGDAMNAQRVWVTNWPANPGGGGMEMGGNGSPKSGGTAPAGSAPSAKPQGRFARLGASIKTGAANLRAGGLAAAGKSALGAVAKVGGAALAVGTAGYLAYDTYKNAKTSEEKGKGYGGAAGGLAGGLAGAKLGALVGTMVFPGIGTVLGGLVGGAAGALLGEKLGSAAGGKLGAAGDKTAPAAVLAAKPATPPAAPKPAPVGSVVPAAPVAALAAKSPPAPVVLNVALPPVPAATPPVMPKPAPMGAAFPAAPVAALAALPPAAAALRPQTEPVPIKSLPAATSAAASAAKPVVPNITLEYKPVLTIQGDPLPGTAEKFKAMLNQHRDEILRLVNQAIENKARAAY